MSNLLDQASIVLTPTAYDNGKVLCAKPTDGSGDFDFSRNSAATRVNAQGLVEDVQILSSNLVQNGDFSQTGSEEVTNGSFANGNADWTIENTWTIGEGVANGNGANGSTAELKQTSVNTIGKSYKATFKVLNYVSGSVGFFRGSGIGVTPRTADGVYTEYFTATSSEIRFRGSNFNGSITNISVKEVGQNWTLGTGWEIGSNVANAVNAPFGSQLIDSTTLTASKKYSVSFNISNYVKGSVRIGVGNSFSSDVSSNGDYTFILTALNTNAFKVQTRSGGSGTSLSITNISVIEITNDTNLPRISYEGFSYQDALGSEEITNGDFSSGATGWVVGTGWSVVDGKANKVSGTESDINQTNGLATQGLSYLFSYDVNLTSGTVQAAVKGGSGQLFNTVGTHTVSEIIVAGSGPTDFKITAKSGFNGSVDNVSVKEYKGQEVVPSSGCGNWLWEPQSTNLITYSEDFTQWDKINSNVISINETNPINSVAYEIESTVSSNKSRIYYNSLMVSGSSYSTSYLVKPSSNSPQYLGFACISNTTPDVFYNFSNNQFEDNTIVGNAAKCESIQMLNGWRLLKVPIHNNVTNTRLNIYQGGISGGELIGVNGQSYYLKFAQLEEQSYVTSYIPTDGTTVTRNQDACTNGGSVSTINSTEGVLYAEIAALANENVQRILSISDGTHNNTVKLGFLNSATDYRLFADIRLGGVNQAFLTFNFGAVAPTFKKCAIKYKQNDFALWIDGVEVATDTSGNTFSANTLNELTFTRGDAAQNFFGETKCLAVWKEALTDTELAELTTI